MTSGGVPIVIQARMGSRRLPGKVLSDIGGRPLLAHCLARLSAAGTGPVVVATTTAAADDAVHDLTRALGYDVVRGPEEDVLQRFVLAADYLHARFFIRATADNPAVDIDAAARVTAAFEATGADHVVESGLPYGAAVEGVRMSALYQAAAQAREPYDREHVTPYLYRNPTRFLAVTVDAPEGVRRPDLRLTVDTPEDLAFMRRVFDAVRTDGSLASLASIIRAADHAAREAELVP